MNAFVIAKHAIDKGHNFDFDDVEIVNKEIKYNKRLILEKLHIKRDKKLIINKNYIHHFISEA